MGHVDLSHIIFARATQGNPLPNCSALRAGFPDFESNEASVKISLPALGIAIFFYLWNFGCIFAERRCTKRDKKPMYFKQFSVDTLSALLAAVIGMVLIFAIWPQPLEGVSTFVIALAQASVLGWQKGIRELWAFTTKPDPEATDTTHDYPVSSNASNQGFRVDSRYEKNTLGTYSTSGSSQAAASSTSTPKSQEHRKEVKGKCFTFAAEKFPDVLSVGVAIYALHASRSTYLENNPDNEFSKQHDPQTQGWIALALISAGSLLSLIELGRLCLYRQEASGHPKGKRDFFQFFYFMIQAGTVAAGCFFCYKTTLATGCWVFNAPKYMSMVTLCMGAVYSLAMALWRKEPPK